MTRNMMVTLVGSGWLASIVKLPALRALIHKNACGFSSGVSRIRRFAVAAALPTVRVLVFAAIVTEPAELP